MSPPEWHIRFAFAMLEMADISLSSKKYPVVITAVLKALEEIMDAYAAKDCGLHFHNEYPDVGPQKRISWIKTARPDLFGSWEKAIQCIDPNMSDGIKMQEMVNILRASLTRIKDESKSFPD